MTLTCSHDKDDALCTACLHDTLCDARQLTKDDRVQPNIILSSNNWLQRILVGSTFTQIFMVYVVIIVLIGIVIYVLVLFWHKKKTTHIDRDCKHCMIQTMASVRDWIMNHCNQYVQSSLDTTKTTSSTMLSSPSNTVSVPLHVYQFIQTTLHQYRDTSCSSLRFFACLLSSNDEQVQSHTTDNNHEANKTNHLLVWDASSVRLCNLISSNVKIDDLIPVHVSTRFCSLNRRFRDTLHDTTTIDSIMDNSAKRLHNKHCRAKNHACTTFPVRIKDAIDLIVRHGGYGFIKARSIHQDETTYLFHCIQQNNLLCGMFVAETEIKHV